LVVAEGEEVPRYRMLGTIKEYAEQRLGEAGEAELVRRAHLAYFAEFAERAEPYLRRAEQLDWLGRLEAEHDNIGAAMRGALAVGEADEAMRLAAASSWYWWLGGHKAEGNDLIMAATALPGEVADEIQARVYAFAVTFLVSGRGDHYHAAEWIHKVSQISRRIQSRHPAVKLVAQLDGLLQTPAPDALLPAFEPLLTDEDAWVRAVARLRLGRMRIMLGDDTVIEILEVRGQTVRIGIDAPRSIPVYREEIWLEVKRENQAAAEAAAAGDLPQFPATPPR